MSWKSLLLVAAFAVGCGKKKEPENAGGPTIEASVGVVDVNIKKVPDGQDQRWINVPVTVKNNLGGPITVNKIEWKINVGTQDLGANSKQFDQQIAAGATGEFTLTNEFAWKDETGLVDDQAKVTGTISWTGPKGNQNSTAIDLLGKIKKEEGVKMGDQSPEAPAQQ